MNEVSPTPKEVRQSIISVIESASIQYEPAPAPPSMITARMWARWILGLKLGETAQHLAQKVAGKYEGKVHGFMVSRYGFEEKRITPVPNPALPGAAQLLKEPVKYDCLWTYRVWGFWQFIQGEDDDNSEDWMELEIEAVKARFHAEPFLGMDARTVYGHNDLQAPPGRVDTFPMGGKLVHVIQGTLGVKLYQTFTPQT
jgi:hypothetical protein